MRNGGRSNKKFIIYLGRLSENDKERFINLLKAKLGLESKLIRNGRGAKPARSDRQRAV